MKDDDKRYASPDQLLLSRLYQYVSTVGFLLILFGFFLYGSGALTSTVPVADMSLFWHLSSEDFAAETGTPYGWDLFGHLRSGDMISLASLVLMPMGTILAFVVMAVVFSKGRNWVFSVIVLLLTVVLILAASGVVSG